MGCLAGPGGVSGGVFTSADPLFLARQNPRSVDHTDALQHWVRQLCTHKPGHTHTHTHYYSLEKGSGTSLVDWHVG